MKTTPSYGHHQHPSLSKCNCQDQPGRRLQRFRPGPQRHPPEDPNTHVWNWDLCGSGMRKLSHTKLKPRLPIATINIPPKCFKICNFHGQPEYHHQGIRPAHSRRPHGGHKMTISNWGIRRSGKRMQALSQTKLKPRLPMATTNIPPKFHKQ